MVWSVNFALLICLWDLNFLCLFNVGCFDGCNFEGSQIKQGKFGFLKKKKKSITGNKRGLNKEIPPEKIHTPRTLL